MFLGFTKLSTIGETILKHDYYYYNAICDENAFTLWVNGLKGMTLYDTIFC